MSGAIGHKIRAPGVPATLAIELELKTGIGAGINAVIRIILLNLISLMTTTFGFVAVKQ